jgi:hypothetical protein
MQRFFLALLEFEVRLDWHSNTWATPPSLIPFSLIKFSHCKARLMAQVVKSLSSKFSALSSNPRTTKNNNIKSPQIFRLPPTSKIIKCINFKVQKDNSHEKYFWHHSYTRKIVFPFLSLKLIDLTYSGGSKPRLGWDHTLTNGKRSYIRGYYRICFESGWSDLTQQNKGESTKMKSRLFKKCKISTQWWRLPKAAHQVLGRQHFSWHTDTLFIPAYYRTEKLGQRAPAIPHRGCRNPSHSSPVLHRGTMVRRNAAKLAR